MDYRPYDNKQYNEDKRLNYSFYKFLIIVMLLRTVALMYFRYQHEDMFFTNGFLFFSYASLLAVWIPVIRSYRIFWDVLIVLILSVLLEFGRMHLIGTNRLFPAYYAYKIRSITPFFPIAYLKYKLWKMEQR